MAMDGWRRVSRSKARNWRADGYGDIRFRVNLSVMFILVPILSLLLQSCDARQNLPTETEALLAFKAAADPRGMLSSSWIANTPPCGHSELLSKPWIGIQCTDGGRVSSINLSNLSLSGTFPENTLSRLDELRKLTVSENSFTGPIPDDLSNVTGLTQLSAENANFSGPFPKFLISRRETPLSIVSLAGNHHSGPIPDLRGLTSLTVLDLSRNSFNKTIPALPSKLVALDLSYNLLTGQIPPSLPASIQQLNFSNNQLSGPIPSYLANWLPISSFENNNLCGLPLSPCPIAISPGTSPDGSKNGASPSETNASAPSPTLLQGGGPLSNIITEKTALIVVAVVVGAILVVIGCILAYYKWKLDSPDLSEKPATLEVSEVSKVTQNDVHSTSSTFTGNEAYTSKLHLFDSAVNFGLDELLCASALVLGKGSLGTTYRALLDNGIVVVVKRLKNVKEGERDVQRHMEFLGRLKHPNLAPWKGYYCAKQQSLLVYDFLPHGSLFSRLHDRGLGRLSFDWGSRLQVAYGVASGMAYLHSECPPERIPHGNLKSSNILLGQNHQVYVAEFGILPLISSRVASQCMAAYRAPECRSQAKALSHKADVYSFGVLLLELLTGRKPIQSRYGEGIDLPDWVKSVIREEWTGEVFDSELKSSRRDDAEMVALLQLAVSCVTTNPDNRPRMEDVLMSIKDIVGRSSDSFDGYHLPQLEDGSQNGFPLTVRGISRMRS